MSDIEMIQLEPQHLIGVRRSVHVTKLGPFFAEVLPKVFQWAGTHGVAPASMPIAVWQGMDMESGIADAQAGCFVAEPSEGEGEITAGVTAGGDVLKLVHTGSYETMSQSWQRVFARAAELGRAPGAGWEIYVDDPTTTAPEALRTEIYLPLQ